MSEPLRIEERPSPNWGPRQGGARPDMVVLHYTGMESAEDALERLTGAGSGVSAHYVVREDGGVLRLVDEANRAWHSGVSAWGDVDDVNSRSIGIEIVNRGHEFGYHPFPEPQMRALELLLAEMLGRWSIPPERVVGHACVAPGRKIDPGEKFDWRRLALEGVAVWLDGPATAAGEGMPDAGRFQQAARVFGYAAPASGVWDGLTRDYWDAFVGRFRPSEHGREPREAGIVHLEALARRWPVRLDAVAPGA